MRLALTVLLFGVILLGIALLPPVGKLPRETIWIVAKPSNASSADDLESLTLLETHFRVNSTKEWIMVTFRFMAEKLETSYEFYLILSFHTPSDS